MLKENDLSWKEKFTKEWDKVRYAIIGDELKKEEEELNNSENNEVGG